MKERFGATDPRSMMLRTHTQTGGSTLTAQQPENNIVRAAIQALAAALGGVQSMALSCYDEALAIPTEKAQKIAVRTQQIIAEEIGVTDTIDPIAGSYYVEWLTNELERRAVEEMEKIEQMGGAVEAIDSGYYHKAILDEAYKWEQDVNEGERIVVGVNKYRDDEEPEPEYFRVDQTMAERAAREARAAARRARLGGRGAGAGAAARGGRGRREPDAGDHRGGPRLLHAGRDLRHDARRLRRIQGACHDLRRRFPRRKSGSSVGAACVAGQLGICLRFAWTLVAKAFGADWGTAAAFGQMAFAAALVALLLRAP